MLGQVLAVSLQRGALDAGRLARGEPQLTGFGHGDAAALGGVDSLGDVDGDLRVIGLGVLLARERLEVPVLELVGVVDHPGLTRFTALGFPTALTDGH